MDWVKLLTDLEGHPKVLAAGNAATGVYVRSLAYCGKYETDGCVPKEWAEQAVAREGQQDLPGRLVDQGLWEESEAGYQIRDFTEVNRSKEQMNELRETRSIAGEKGGKANGKAKRKQKQGKSHSSSSSNSSSSSSGKQKPDPNELPADFDPQLAEAARRCLPILHRTAEARSAKPVHLLPVARAIEQHPVKDHVAVAGSVEHWLVHGNGAKRPAKDIVVRFRNFLSDSPDAEVRVSKAPTDRSAYAKVEAAT